MTSTSAAVDLTPANGTRHARAFDRRLLALAMRERGALVSSVALGLAIAVARVGTGAALALGLGAVLRTGAWHTALVWIGIAVGLILVRALMTAVQSGTLAGASVRITTRLRMRLVSTILALGPRWLGRERSGELQAVLVDGVERLDSYFRLFLAKVAAAAITAVAILGTVVVIDPPTGACIAVFAAAVILAPSAEYRALGHRMRFWSDSYRPLSAEFVDNLQGMTTLKTFGVAEERGRELRRRSADIRDAAIRLVTVSGYFRGLTTMAAADADDSRLWQALATAGAEEFVRSLPAGLDTVVGERGLRLSGGQRQRIAIARALLKNAPILILDEATSNVDVATEESIQKSLRTLRRGRTTLIIAHRLSTVHDADRILVLDNGRIAEQGGHDQLIRQRGRYAALVAAQAMS